MLIVDFLVLKSIHEITGFLKGSWKMHMSSWISNILLHRAVWKDSSQKVRGELILLIL